MKRLHQVMLIFGLCLHSPFTFSQERIKLSAPFCSLQPVKSNGGDVALTNADPSVEALIARILQSAGLPQNFTIRGYDQFNAEARILDDKRYILYDPKFLSSIRESAGTEWGPTGIMAHEIAHHLLGHTIEHKVSNPNLELAADKYAGFILRKMAAGLDEAKSGFGVIAADVVMPGSSHPRRTDRLKAVEDGWKEAEGGAITLQIDSILCSGQNCDLSHIREGEKNGTWQVVRWEDTQKKTEAIGAQLRLSDSQIKEIFCRDRLRITAGDLKERVVAADFYVSDNKEQARYFDLDGPKANYFRWSPLGRFAFVNNYEFETNHHIRIQLLLTIKASCASR
jgi:hypothetical protein